MSVTTLSPESRFGMLETASCWFLKEKLILQAYSSFSTFLLAIE